MNVDQHRNIELLIESISKSLFAAWSYFHLLQGMHDGSKANPSVVVKFDRLFDQLWRAVFDALFAKVGTLIDGTPGTQSLPSLITMVRRYGNLELKSVLKEVLAELEAKEGPLAKFESWRHKAVAHRTKDAQLADFHLANKMNLEEVVSGLRTLQLLLNAVSMNVLRIHNDTETGSKDLIKQCNDLFSLVSRSDLPQ